MSERINGIKLEIETKEYSFNSPGDINREHQARIIFSRQYAQDWKLRECRFYGVCQVYTLEDWKFIRALAERVILIETELNEVKFGGESK